MRGFADGFVEASQEEIFDEERKIIKLLSLCLDLFNTCNGKKDVCY